MKRREEITAEAVARAWLDGTPILTLMEQFDASKGLIQSRIAEARVQHPELPWDKRTTLPPGPSPTRDYTTMNDGRSGEGTVQIGSVVKGRTLRKRGI